MTTQPTPTAAMTRLKAAARARRVLRDGLGRVVTRLQGYAAEHQAENRRKHLASVCRAHPTANIHDAAGFSNATGVPSNISIGANSAVMAEFVLFPQGGRISVGECSFVGPGSRVWSARQVSIGNHVLIAHNVNIHDNISHSTDWRERRSEMKRVLPRLQLVPHEFDLQSGQLVIEDDVWIGLGASVLGGVRIGRGAIVGAGTIVTKDVPAFSLAVGNPMRIVRSLDGASDVHRWTPGALRSEIMLRAGAHSATPITPMP